MGPRICFWLTLLLVVPARLLSQELVSLPKLYSFQVQDLLPAAYRDQAFVQEFGVATNSLFFMLSPERNTRLKPLIVRTSDSGAYRGFFELPNADLRGLAVSSEERLMLFQLSRENPGFVEYDARGLLLRRIAVSRPAWRFGVADGKVLSIGTDGTIETRDLAKGKVAQTQSRPRPLTTLFEPLASDRVLIIDQMEALFEILDLGTGAETRLSIRSAELDEALTQSATRYESLKKITPPDAQPGRPLVAVSSARVDRRIYVLIFPYDVHRGAVVLELGAEGKLLRRLRCAPGGSFQKFAPRKVGIAPSKLFLVSASGEVAAYELP